jgi:MFS family permease
VPCGRRFVQTDADGTEFSVRVVRRVIAFAGAALVAALSPTPLGLTATRALLGIARATLAPSTLALVRNMWSFRRLTA